MPKCVTKSEDVHGFTSEKQKYWDGMPKCMTKNWKIAWFASETYEFWE